MEKKKNRFTEPLGGRVIGKVEITKKEKKQANKEIDKFTKKKENKA